MAKFYWILCGVLFVGGVCIAVLTAVCHNPDSDIGEMPLAFGLGVDIAFLGIAGFFAGLLAKGVSILLRKWKK